MALRTSSPTSAVDDQHDILKHGPSQRTLLTMGAALAAIVYMLPDKKEGEKFALASSLEIDRLHNTPQDTTLSVNVENYLQIISELEEKLKYDPNYKPNATELDALEWRRVYNMLFDGIEPKK